ncbi:MAG TPA: PEP/pyruvate-binding domain-containing protein [Kofleriaceae bacterium]|nr:PEP/pyruvate-binding domain-containing protein [Kofleriaceae bacterium]
MAIRSLRDADAGCGAKARGLARLLAAGLPVPDGFALDAQVFRDIAAIDDVAPDAIGHTLEAAAQRIAEAAIPAALEREVAERAAALGRLAVRSSASIEDGALGAAAGVFASLTDVAPDEVWHAIRAVWTSALTPLAVAYARRRSAAIAIGVIVQRFVPGERVTVYTRPIGAPQGQELWLARGDLVTPIARADAAGHPEVVLALAAEAAIGSPDGADVELVVEGSQIRIVQARPMVHPARQPRGHAARPAPPPILLAALRADGRPWTWDIAHNPDPLSPAQAGLVERIDRAAWSPSALRVCGGYLYTAPRAPVPRPTPPADRAELVSRIAAIEGRLAPLLGGAATVAEAVEQYVALLAIWTCELSPLVASARRILLDRLAEVGHPPQRIPALAAALIGPRRVARDSVMSPAWDVAVPTFAELAELRGAEIRGAPVERRLAPPPAAPEDLAAAVDLARAAADAGEQDDLWFARAQWLVRKALLAHARELELRDDDIFWIPLDDAVTLRTLDPDDTHRRAAAARAAHARAAAWDMPLTVHGDACGESPHTATLRGVGIGPRTVGRVVRFASLAAARPVSRDDVVVTRAVTPALAMLVDGCAALVSETGGLLDHGAALARELGVTCVVGCAGAWSTLGDGARVSVDGDAGLVSLLQDDAEHANDA